MAAVKLSRAISGTVKLAYEVHGKSLNNKRPIVILHGLLDSKTAWTQWAKELNSKTERLVVTLDARNHGGSSHSPNHSYRYLAADVNNFLDDMNLKNVSLVGHSMGGKTAMIVALLNPKVISSLIVIDISPVGMVGFIKNGFDKVIDAMLAVDFQDISSIEDAVDFVRVKLNEHRSERIRTMMPMILRNIGQREDNTIGWTSNLEVLRDSFPKLRLFPYWPDKQYLGPTLFIGATKTPYLNPGDLSLIQNQFPDSKLRFVRDVGHSVHEDDPAELLRLASDFLKKH